MKKVNLIYKFNGDFEAGADLFLVSQSMHALGTLITTSKGLLYPNHPPLSVKVAPFAKGSFEIQLFLQPATNADMLMDLIKPQSVKDIKSLLANIGLILGTTADVITILGCGGLIALLAWLRGAPKKIEKIDGDKYKYTNVDGETTEVNESVHILAQNETIRRAVSMSIATPLEDGQIADIECSVLDEVQTTTTIKKHIALPLIKCAQEFFPTLDSDSEEFENVRDVWVYPRKVNLEGGERSWTFSYLGDEQQSFKMGILDEVFLESVKDGKVRMAARDTFYVTIKERQILQGGKATVTRDIVKVLKHRMSPDYRQLSLFNGK